MRLRLAVALLAVLPSGAASAAPVKCTDARWVGAWAASPSDASQGTDLLDMVDGSAHPKLPLNNQTVRVVLTPTLGGSTVRVRLTNRFGRVPVTFANVTAARRTRGAAVDAGSLARVTFGGQQSVTVPPGEDVVSDAAALQFAAFEPLAVSVYVPEDIGKPTEHLAGRQTSYLTLAGDATADATGVPYVVTTTARPLVSGLSVRATGSTGAVAAFGDSLTDGFQGSSLVVEDQGSLDADGRWTDVLGRRLVAAGRRLSALNAGISGNRVLVDGPAGGGTDWRGPSLLHRLDADVLSLDGVTTVILLAGANDLGRAPDPTPAELIAGYEDIIGRFHAAGLRVLQGRSPRWAARPASTTGRPRPTPGARRSTRGSARRPPRTALSTSTPWCATRTTRPASPRPSTAATTSTSTSRATKPWARQCRSTPCATRGARACAVCSRRARAERLAPAFETEGGETCIVRD